MKPYPISVVLPVYNGERFIEQAMESVLAEPVSELIVVDDGSDDDTLEAVYGNNWLSDTRSVKMITVVRTEHVGCGHARNVGIRKASYPWIAFIDADDLWLPGKTERQWEALKNAVRKPCYVSSDVEQFVEDGFEKPAGLGAHKLGVISLNFPTNLICHRTVFEYVGGFDPGLVCANDVDWFRRAHELGIDRVHVPEVLVKKRVHDQNLSLCQGHDMQRQIFEAIGRKVVPGLFPIW